MTKGGADKAVGARAAQHQVFLALGSNLGDREALIRRAVQLIGERVGPVLRLSSLIETEPWGFSSANKFLNGVLLCQTELTPRQVLQQTQQIERDMGRKPRAATDAALRRTYKDRPIDIDILLYDDWTVDEPDLHIPHPLMQERDFVMIPLREITNP